MKISWSGKKRLQIDFLQFSASHSVGHNYVTVGERLVWNLRTLKGEGHLDLKNVKEHDESLWERNGT